MDYDSCYNAHQVAAYAQKDPKAAAHLFKEEL